MVDLKTGVVDSIHEPEAWHAFRMNRSLPDEEEKTFPLMPDRLRPQLDEASCGLVGI
ncbi:hypothetical protein HNY42_15970 (plasmid) [Exiguobacterium sp. Helios]|uniref:hypothetical protein n=1 Tax=Exiguobacterium sp. Helios TaxID=2735868 RepID=UPI00165DFB85|nr:hypothetical protein [Exiguobacterium sp. Helios]QNR22496.1 hypothetical protein HNY42_15970 [Exiguobacterium sp. Helios]